MKSDKLNKMSKLFDIRKLKSFHRKGTYLPGTAPDEEDKIAELDPNLQPEEHSYVNHYLSYADRLLETDADGEEDAIKEPPDKEEDEQSIQDPPHGDEVQTPQKVDERGGKKAAFGQVRSQALALIFSPG